jgi:thiamine pyrophosphate-dependent acetolactate synthase large subunit-like protein
MGSTTPLMMYTAAFAFFDTLWEAGVTHCFVNLGSDHPSIMEAMVKGQRGGKFPRIITCPSEVPSGFTPLTLVWCVKRK